MAEFTAEELEAEAAGLDPVEPTQEQQEARARDEQGRFAPAEPQAEPEQRTRTVPHQALHQEREAHKQTRAQYQAAQEQLAQLQTIRDRVRAAQANPQPQEPTFQQPTEQDGQQQPVPGLDHLQKRLDQIEQGNRQRETREQEAGIDQQEARVLHNTLAQAEAEFRQQTPDYGDAADHLLKARARQLQIMGVPDHEILDTIREEATDITRVAIQQGRSPAEVVYDWAQTYGYQPRGQQAPQQQGNAMLDAIAKGQKQGRSLSSARGGASTSDVNANAIANMGEDEFQALYATPEGKKIIDALG